MPNDIDSDVPQDEFGVLAQVLDALKKLNAEDRERILRTVATFFGLSVGVFSQPSAGRAESASSAESSFSEDRSISPKQFLLEKSPRTDVERVACLGFYLAHYRDTPHFKTLDISKLNTEAAQVKFANAAYAVANATKMRYLAPAAKGTKQLSALGENFVLALPDREKAKAAMAQMRLRRRSRRTSQPNPKQSDDSTSNS